ncbi:ATP-binding cassette domain-containing protein [Nocardiopsis coralliicola]
MPSGIAGSLPGADAGAEGRGLAFWESAQAVGRGDGTAVISIRGLTKQYGGQTAVDGLTFDVRPGAVSGFLGPNGAGKSTTLRVLLGLARPTRGEALVGGLPYARLERPGSVVGAVLDAGAVHPGRTGRAHLRALARGIGVAPARVPEVLDTVGLDRAADRRTGGYSLGMRQRLGIAAALLGDPAVLVLDEPMNGLDLDGVRWMRTLLAGLAAEGRTVLVASHLMGEMELIADHVVVVAGGRLVADAPLGELVREWTRDRVTVRSPEADALAERLCALGRGRAQTAVEVERIGEQELRVDGLTAAAVGDAAHAAGARVHALASEGASLERVYVEMTEDAAEHVSGAGAGSGSGAESGRAMEARP